MAGVKLSVDDRAFRRAVDHFYRGTVKDRSEVLLRYARLACVSLAHQTQPFGTGKNVRDSAQRTVAGEIGRVYEPIGQVYGNLKQTGQTFSDVERIKSSAQAAAAFVRMVREGDRQGATELLNNLRIQPYFTTQVQKFDDGGEHRRSRHGARRKVPRNTFTKIAVTNINKLKSYVRQVVARVGTAKAGWASCAQQLGGTRGIPQWVYRHAQQNRLGEVSDASFQPRRPYVLMVNRVPWIDKCLNASQVRRALDIQRQKMVLAINRQVRARARAHAL